MKRVWLRQVAGAVCVAMAGMARVLGVMPFGEAAVLASVCYGVALWVSLPVYACVRLLLAPELLTLVPIGACCVAAVACRLHRSRWRPLCLVWYVLSRCGEIVDVVSGASPVRFAISVLLGALALGIWLVARSEEGRMREGGVAVASVVLGAGAHTVALLGAFGAGLAVRALRRGEGAGRLLLYGAGALLATGSPATVAVYACVYAVGKLLVSDRIRMGLGMVLAALAATLVCGEGGWWACAGLSVGILIGVLVPVGATGSASELADEPPSLVRQALLRSAQACRGMEIAMDGDALDLGAMAGALSARMCEGCAYAAQCNVDGNAFLEAARRAVAQRRAGLEVIPDAIVDSCRRAAELPSQLGSILKEYECHLALNEMRTSACALVAGELKAFSGLLTRLATLSAAPVSVDGELSAALTERTEAEVLVYRTAGGLTVRTEAEGDAVLQATERATGRRYCLDAVVDGQDGRKEYSLVAAPSLHVVYGVSQACKADATLCGDTYCVKRLRADCVLAVLCDGMGSGKGAHLLSERTIGVIESCFSAGFSVDEVLPLVNFLLALGGERFSCVDLCVLDLSHRRATFIKMGGVQSYLIRKSEVCRIEGGALPMGVERLASPTVTTVAIEGGDTVVLSTDGVTDVYEPSALVDPNPQTAADNILACAIASDGGACHDDMTALVLRAV